MHPPKLSLLGALTSGKTERHLIKLPGAALANDEPRPVITVTGAKDGPVLFVNAGVHGGEYSAIEAVIRLGKTLDATKIAGTIILMPVLNLPAFRSRTPFVCPIDNVNPNRVFPGDPNGSYSEQMTHASFTSSSFMRMRSSIFTAAIFRKRWFHSSFAGLATTKSR